MLQSNENGRLPGDSYELAIKAQTGELRSFAAPPFVIPVRGLGYLGHQGLRQLRAPASTDHQAKGVTYV